jgi:hypothetical protein
MSENPSMTPTPLRRALVLVSFCGLLSGCAGLAGDWPSLQLPAEKAAAAGTGSALATPAATSATAAGPELAGLLARLDEEQRGLETSERRWAEQIKAAQSAANGARGEKQGSLAWSTAQAELTRLNQIAADFADRRLVAYQLAGNLAAQAAQGRDATAALTATGRLVLALDASVNRNIAAIAALQSSLDR